MASLETQQLDDIIVRSRRKMLSLGSAALAGLAVAGVTKAQAQGTTLVDADYLNFALNLEYLEAQFYNLAVSGVTIDKLATPIGIGAGTAASTGAGTVTLKPSFAKVPFALPTIAAYAAETAIEEAKHVTFLRSALGASAVAMPNIDLYNSFNTLANGAGIAPTFDPFASDATFLIGAYIFEDVGVTAYHGAAAAITTNSTLVAAAGILAVEAYHAGLVRTSINQVDAGAGVLTGYTKKISAFRSLLANPAPSTTVDDTGITTVNVALNGTAATYVASTIVDKDVNSLAITRTPQQILAIVTGTTPTATTHNGVFFPAGLNGNVK